MAQSPTIDVSTWTNIFLLFSIRMALQILLEMTSLLSILAPKHSGMYSQTLLNGKLYYSLDSSSGTVKSLQMITLII